MPSPELKLMKNTPTSTQKALSLLEFFSERRPWIGLSEFSKLSGYNKATTLRMLKALESKGFIEQDETNRSYGLGTAFLRYAQLREAVFPLTQAVMVLLQELGEATGEMAHASLMTGDALATIGSVQSTHSNRVFIEAGEALPLHATASGLVYLAFSSEETINQALSGKLSVHGENTLTDPAAVRALMQQIREQGYAIMTGSYENGVTGIAAPCFDAKSRACGAIAVAMPAIRASEDAKHHAVKHLRHAASKFTQLRGGTMPADFPAPPSPQIG